MRGKRPNRDCLGREEVFIYKKLSSHKIHGWILFVDEQGLIQMAFRKGTRKYAKMEKIMNEMS